MMTLPNEMLIMIFEKIGDVSVLLRLREVSRRFLDVIEFLLVKLDVWKKFCYADDEVRSWIREIIKLKFSQTLINEFDSSDPSNWKEIYLSYQKWQKLANRKYPWTISNIDPRRIDPNEIITCMDAWGQDLVIGTNTGSIYFYKIRNELKFKLAYNIKYHITKIKLWFVGHRTLIAVVFLINRKMFFWNMAKKKKIKRISFDQVTTATVCNDRRFYIAINTDVYEYEWRAKKIREKHIYHVGNHVNNQIKRPTIIKAMYADQNKLTVIFRNGQFVSTISYIISTPGHDNFARWIGYFDSVPLQDIIFYIPINNVTLAITDSNLYISRKNEENYEYQWQRRPLDEPLRNNISAVLMYSNILLLGLKTGRIILYFLEQLEQLSDLSRRPLTIRKLSHNTNPITNLNIVELNDYLYILATTTSELHICRCIV